MEDEIEILSQVSDPAAGLFPDYAKAEENIKSLAGNFTGDFSMISNSAIQILLSSGFFKTLEKEAQIKQDDIQNIVGKFVKLQEITLTNKNILLLCKKQWRSKENKLIILPLKYATDVKLDKGRERIGKNEAGKMVLEPESIYISFRVSQVEDDELGCFSLGLSVDNPSVWLKAIEKIIGADMLKVSGPEKICASVHIGVRGSRRGHELCFTQKRIVVSKFWNHLPIWKLVLGALLAVVGMLAVMLGALSSFLNFVYHESYPETYLLLASGALFITVSFGSIRFWRNSRLKNLVQSSPESILESDKDSFEIPYSDIVQVKVRKKGVVSKQFKGIIGYMDILTEKKKYEFLFAKETQLADFLRFVSRVLPERKIIAE